MNLLSAVELIPFERQWSWNNIYPDDELFYQWMEKPRSRRFMDWMIDQFQSASKEAGFRLAGRLRAEDSKPKVEEPKTQGSATCARASLSWA